MEKKESSEGRDFTKIGTYKGYDVLLLRGGLPRENVATMLPNEIGIAKAIVIRPDAYEILKSRPDFLKRVYEHELRENATGEEVTHSIDGDILRFLRENGYDFGELEYNEEFWKKLN